jgi:predicted nucleotidyltransferase
MLDIINKLKPFIEDCYKELGVREYSRAMKISPPSASKLLKEFEVQGILKKRADRRYLLFRANKESLVLKDISIIYWKEKLKRIIEQLNSKFYNPTIVLFGSLTKLETNENSDIDLVIFTKIKKDVNLNEYEGDLKRKIQLFKFESLNAINNKELKIEILNGHIVQGEIK